MKAFPPASTFFLSVSLALGIAGCTREPGAPELPLGRPALDVFGIPHPAFTALEISARPPGVPAWNASLEQGPQGEWHISKRSDGKGLDLADAKLVEHFLEIIGTFATEAPAGGGNDATFGLNPYRMEIRLGEMAHPKVLQLGDPVGQNGIYFRLGTAGGRTWVGRGALIAFIPMMETPDSLVYKSPYFAPIDEIQSVGLTKVAGKDRGNWEFSRSGRRWLRGKIPLSDEEAALLERIFRQRLVQVLPTKDLPDLAHPDWKLTVHTARGEETLTIVFSLTGVLAKNPARSDHGLELYPEFAGALRAFTQARFTSVKSRTK